MGPVHFNKTAGEAGGSLRQAPQVIVADDETIELKESRRHLGGAVREPRGSPPLACLARIRRVAGSQFALKRRSRRLLVTTVTLDRPIAAAA